MVETQSSLPLSAVKLGLGQPDYLDYRALSAVDAHRRLGEEVRAQVHHILARKFRELAPEALAGQVCLARYCRGALHRKMEQAGDEIRRAALEEYLACLAAWTQGAALADFDAQGLREMRVQGLPLSGDDLAYLLQNDDAGCQTGLWRAADGTVFFWHTEEDREPLGARFDRLRLMAFSVTDQEGRPIPVVAFIYPDLLPGPAFAWRSDNYVQAVDSIGLKPKAPASGILANIATWVTLRLGQSADLDETIRYLRPFADGYALNAAYADGRSAWGRKVEFAGEHAHSYRLGEAPGSLLYQVNMFSDPTASMARLHEALEPGKRRRLEERLSRAEAWLQALPPEADAWAAVFGFLCSQEGGDYACANGDVKAYLIAQCAPGRLQVSVGAGPALAEDKPEIFELAA